MKSKRNRFGAKKRFSNKRSRPGTTIARRYPLASFEQLELRALLTAEAGVSAWHNTANPWDVNGDGACTPQDALIVINQLAVDGTQAVPSAPAAAPLATTSYSTSFTAAPMTDVNADGLVSPADAEIVVNHLVAPANAQVQYRLEAQDLLTGNPITTVAAGQDFQLAVFVQDVRTPSPANSGVFAAFLNVSYDAGLVSIPSNTPFVYGSSFPLVQVSNLLTPGQILGAGAAGSSLIAPGAAEQFLWKLTVHASAAGVVSFTPSFDTAAGHEPLVYGNDNKVPASDVFFSVNPLQVTILADTNPAISVGDVSHNEGNSLTTNYVFTVSLAQATGQQLTVNYATQDGTATTANGDYVAKSGTLTFAAGQTSQLVTVTVNGDTTVEADEIFNLVLSSPTGGTIDAQHGTAAGTIVNDDLATININNVSQSEGNNSVTNFVFTVTLNAPAATNVFVPYQTQNGSASTANNDYAATSGTLTFIPNTTSQAITVAVNGDAVFELNEAFTVVLTQPANGLFGTGSGTGTGTITNDDDAPALAISNVSHVEGNLGTTDYVFQVTLSGSTAVTATVAFATANGTATVLNNDYVAQSGTLAFSSGTTSQLITVVVNGDANIEADEAFTVVLSNASNATISTGTGTGTIVNDDFPVISISNSSHDEGNASTTPFVFTVSLSASAPFQILVPFQTQDGTATTANSDYVAKSGTLTFSPGTTAQSITVLVNGDIDPEQNETFNVNLTKPNNANFDSGNGVGTGTIVNDDGPRLSITPATINVAEDNLGTKDVVFTVTSNFDTANTVTVVYSTADGTATVASNDYVPTSGTITFDPHVTTQLVTVQVNGDAIFENNETFTVNLSNPTNATLLQPTATATITNEDVQPTLNFSPVSVSQSEGSPGQSDMLFTVTLTGQTELPVSVQYQTVDGAATVVGNDYLATSGTLAFTPGQTSQVITVKIVGDTTNEADENFTVQLTNPTGATISNGTATGTIQNDDLVPSISIADLSQSEGNSGTTNFVFTATLAQASGQLVTVVYTTADGTALSAAGATQDYVATSGTLTFQPGQTTRSATVVVNGDTQRESDETFTVVLSSPTNATISDGTATGTITNDDPVPTISITAPAAQNEGNTGSSPSTPFVFTVSLSNASDQQVTVNFTTLNGTATTVNTDFVGQAGTLTFTAGVTQQLITVAVNGDTIDEADENFSVQLSSPSGATLSGGGATLSAAATIVDDDAPPTVSINDVSHLEGNTGNTAFVFQVTLSQNSGKTVTVAFATANGTATTANNDYTATSGTLTFTPGITTQSITVQAVGDLVKEADETFVVNLSSPSNATLLDGQGTGTIQNEDVFAPSQFGGNAFIDSNNNSSMDPKEVRLSNLSVTLDGTDTAQNAVHRTTTTAANGSYNFADLSPGNYTVRFNELAKYLPAHVSLGTQGGNVLANPALGLSFSVGAAGGVTGTGNNLMTRGLQPSQISQRDFLASHITPSSVASTLAIPAATPAVVARASALVATGNSDSITQSGGTVTVHGTSGNDQFEFTAGAVMTVKINGVSRAFAAGSVTAVNFDGRGGDDSVNLTGSAADEVVSLGLGFAVLSGAGYQVNVSNATSIAVHGGGGHDTATLQDSAFDDFLEAAGDSLTVTNNQGFDASLADFAEVHAKSTAGGHDTSQVGTIDFVLSQEGSWIHN